MQKPKDGFEKRRVRFVSIEGLNREDLPLAAEIWYADLVGQIWTSREVIKLGILFARYMSAANEGLLSVNSVERMYNMDVRMTLDTLRQMEMFGAVEAYSIKDQALHASLNLSLLQRLKVLETRERIAGLCGADKVAAFVGGGSAEYWELPQMSGDADVVDDDDAERFQPAA